MNERVLILIQDTFHFGKSFWTDEKEYNPSGGETGCYIRVSTHIAGLAAKPKDVLDTLDLTNFGVKTLLVYWILFRYN